MSVLRDYGAGNSRSFNINYLEMLNVKESAGNINSENASFEVAGVGPLAVESETECAA